MAHNCSPLGKWTVCGEERLRHWLWVIQTVSRGMVACLSQNLRDTGRLQWQFQAGIWVVVKVTNRWWLNLEANIFISKQQSQCQDPNNCISLFTGRKLSSMAGFDFIHAEEQWAPPRQNLWGWPSLPWAMGTDVLCWLLPRWLRHRSGRKTRSRLEPKMVPDAC